MSKVSIRAQLFKTDAVIVNVVKTLIIKYGIYTNIFAEKCELQKLLTFFQQNTCELDTVLTRPVFILTTNKFVKLTMF